IIKAGISVEKVGNVTEAHEGDAVNYTIWVNNTGEDLLYNVWVNDTSIGLSQYIGDLPAHSSHKLYVEHVLSSSPDPFVNTVNVEGYDELGAHYSDSDSFTVDIIKAGISVEKTATPTTVEAGEAVTWNITVENTGDVTLHGVCVVDDNMGMLYSMEILEPGEKLYYEYVTYPEEDVTNTVLANGTDTLGNEVMDGDSATVTIYIPPSLSISKSGSPNAIQPGETLTYTIVIRNTGGSPAENVVVREQYDENFIFLSATPAPDDGTNNKWNLGTIDEGESVTITIVGTAADNNETYLFNVASYTSSNAGSGRATETTQVIYPGIGIEKEAEKDVVEAGELINFTITYYNSGDVDLTNVIITEIYPSYTTFVSATPWPTSGNNLWMIGNLPAHSGGTMTVTLRVDSPLENGTILVNRVNITCDEGAYDEDEAIVTVHVSPSLVIQKSDNPDPVFSGEYLYYTIYVENIGNGNATNVVVTDEFNPLLSIEDADGGTVNGNKITWDIALLSPGESTTFDIVAKVGITDIDLTILNYVNVTCDEGAYDEDEETTLIKTITMAYPFLEIIKDDNPDPVAYGGEIKYTITVKNIGDGAATGVVVKDMIDEGAEFISATPSPDVINGRELVWNLGTVEAGDIVTIYVKVKAIKVGILINNVNVTSSEGLYDEDNETTDVINDTEPPHTWKVFHGEVRNVLIYGIYLLHYIPPTTYITLKSVDYPIPGASGVNHTYYRIWKWNDETKEW
ncbi:MAG TPA: DUF11 domain-containing protein, partial [Thermoplasmatales archaeon]|nr:DUF11 domain-containing protein [Thermoplasmatales archaeon]